MDLGEREDKVLLVMLMDEGDLDKLKDVEDLLKHEVVEDYMDKHKDKLLDESSAWIWSEGI